MNNEPKDFLSEEDKKFIIENYNKMSPFQMALRRDIKTDGKKCPIISEFIKNSKLEPSTSTTPVVVEVKKEVESVEEAIQNIVQENVSEDINPSAIEKETTTVSEEEFAVTLRELNIFIRDPLTEKERRDIRFLLNQMEATRFLYTHRAFAKTEYKKLFKEEFIRSLYGKGEMPQEEVNDFIDVCNETVIQYDIKCKIKELEKRKEEKATSVEQKIAIDNLVIEMNEHHTNSTKRAGEIKKSLGASREQRLKESRPQGLNVLALIETFYNAEKRESMIKLQNKKDDELRRNIELIDELDAAKALILGISPDELLEGGL